MQIEGLKKECKNCGKEFITMEQRRKYCSNTCKTNYHRNKLTDKYEHSDYYYDYNRNDLTRKNPFSNLKDKKRAERIINAYN